MCREDCFAFRGKQKCFCSALNTDTCYECKFYRTKEEYDLLFSTERKSLK